MTKPTPIREALRTPRMVLEAALPHAQPKGQCVVFMISEDWKIKMFMTPLRTVEACWLAAEAQAMAIAAVEASHSRIVEATV